jgi:hypothetical protein
MKVYNTANPKKFPLHSVKNQDKTLKISSSFSANKIGHPKKKKKTPTTSNFATPNPEELKLARISSCLKKQTKPQRIYKNPKDDVLERWPWADFEGGARQTRRGWFRHT